MDVNWFARANLAWSSLGVFGQVRKVLSLRWLGRHDCEPTYTLKQATVACVKPTTTSKKKKKKKKLVVDLLAYLTGQYLALHDTPGPDRLVRSTPDLSQLRDTSRQLPSTQLTKAPPLHHHRSHKRKPESPRGKMTKRPTPFSSRRCRVIWGALVADENAAATRSRGYAAQAGSPGYSKDKQWPIRCSTSFFRLPSSRPLVRRYRKKINWTLGYRYLLSPNHAALTNLAKLAEELPRWKRRYFVLRVAVTTQRIWPMGHLWYLLMIGRVSEQSTRPLSPPWRGLHRSSLLLNVVCQFAIAKRARGLPQSVTSWTSLAEQVRLFALFARSAGTFLTRETTNRLWSQAICGWYQTRRWSGRGESVQFGNFSLREVLLGSRRFCLWTQLEILYQFEENVLTELLSWLGNAFVRNMSVDIFKHGLWRTPVLAFVLCPPMMEAFPGWLPKLPIFQKGMVTWSLWRVSRRLLVLEGYADALIRQRPVPLEEGFRILKFKHLTLAYR